MSRLFLTTKARRTRRFRIFSYKTFLNFVPFVLLSLKIVVIRANFLAGMYPHLFPPPQKCGGRRGSLLFAVKCFLWLRLCRPGPFVVMRAFSHLAAALPRWIK